MSDPAREESPSQADQRPYALALNRYDEWTECYLCAQPLSEPKSRDHLPPKGFLPKTIREKVKLNLVTLPTHRACNEGFKLDEEYVRDSLGPMAQSSDAGKAIMDHLSAKWRAGQGHALAKMVLAEFTNAPGGIELPPSLSAKRFDSARVERVIWKVMRGVYFIEQGRALKPDALITWDIRSKEDGKSLKFERAYDHIHGLPRTEFPGAFDYCLMLDDSVPDTGIGSMLWWDYFTAWTLFRRD